MLEMDFKPNSTP